MAHDKKSTNLMDCYWEMMTGEKSGYFAQLESLCLAESSHALSGEFDVLVKKLEKPSLMRSLEGLQWRLPRRQRRASSSRR
ncbi:MAG: hypothetical protein WCA38_02815 [Candidatus Acidiferrales bacterium]